ncbi:MAG: hypothetical protein WBB28_20450 [Crinalium sp.]
MAYEIINLTLPLVMQEIEDTLKEYAEFPYQVAFSLPKMRQKLVAHVLSQIPNKFSIVEDFGEAPIEYNSLYTPLQERLHTEEIIRQSIIDIVKENFEWIIYHIGKLDIYEVSSNN